MASIVARRWPTVSPSDDCVFDEIASGVRPAHLVLDEEHLLAFLDIRPVFPGHTLVIPRRHVPTIADLEPGLLGPLLDAARRVAAAQRAALGSDGTFLGLNDVVSQSVPHAHFHVIPRRRGDGLRGFFWPRTRYPDEAAAANIAAGLRAALPGPASMV
jgi:histidine triad (HIT) family protein